jgi:hypothetical protein
MPRANQYQLGPVLPGKRRPPPPPPELDERERKIWRTITSQLPDNWFSADNMPLLKELCRHVRHADDLSVDIALARGEIERVRAEPKRDPFNKLWLEALAEYRSLLRLHALQSQQIGVLSTKMRLTPQSRYDKTYAAKTTRGSSYPDPWSDWAGYNRSESDDPDEPSRKQ